MIGLALDDPVVSVGIAVGARVALEALGRDRRGRPCVVGLAEESRRGEKGQGPRVGAAAAVRKDGHVDAVVWQPHVGGLKPVDAASVLDDHVPVPVLQMIHP